MDHIIEDYFCNICGRNPCDGVHSIRNSNPKEKIIQDIVDIICSHPNDIITEVIQCVIDKKKLSRSDT